MLVDLGVGVFSAQFGCLSWSRCEHKLLYVAEKSRNTSAETGCPQPERTKVLKHTQPSAKLLQLPNKTEVCVSVCVLCHCTCVQPGQECVLGRLGRGSDQ